MFKILQFAALLILAYALGRRLMRAIGEAPEDRRRRAASESNRGPKGTEPEPSAGGSTDPHDILGVPRGSSGDAIRKAYQERIRKYHPDYLENMAPELRELAEERTKQINQAYETLRRRAAP